MFDKNWAVVELLGHVRIAGLVSEVEMFGSKLGRIDIPLPPVPGCAKCFGIGLIPSAMSSDKTIKVCEDCRSKFVTQFFGGQSVYRLTVVTEEAARVVASCNAADPVHEWEIPKSIAGRVYEDEMDDEEIERLR